MHFGFSVAAAYDRRFLIQWIPALIERRYSKLTHFPNTGKLENIPALR